MINKYTLRFIDCTIEKQYQQFLTVTLRKYILLIIIIISLQWSVMDFLQAIIEKNFTQLSLEIIISQYASNLMITFFYLLVYFCKPNLIKWALFLSNHALAYIYWSADELYTYWQSNLCTFIMVSAQMLTLISADCLEMIYQLILFTSIYITKMILENKPFTYSLIVGALIAGIGFILIFYYIQKSQREQYRLGQVNHQWENIFITLIQNKCLIFDYNDHTKSFNYKNQKQFFLNITDTLQLRQFLRSAMPQGQINNLEQYLYNKLLNHSTQKINQESILIKQKQKEVRLINITIFQGIRPIIVIQQGEQEKQINKNIETDQKQIIQHRVLMQQARQFIFSSNKNKTINFFKFKRYWIYQNCREKLIFQILPIMKINLIKLLKCLRSLYPEKKIKMINHQQHSNFQNNLNLLTIILIETLECVLSQEVTIELGYLSDQNSLITIKGYFNDKLIYLVKKKSKKFRYFIAQISVKLFGKQNFNNQKFRLLQVIYKRNMLESAQFKIKGYYKQFPENRYSLNNFFLNFMGRKFLQVLNKQITNKTQQAVEFRAINY